jgi:hypothetical protein
MREVKKYSEGYCRGLPTRLLGSRVRFMAVRLLCFVMRCVVSGLSDELDARSEESYRLCVCVYVCV